MRTRRCDGFLANWRFRLEPEVIDPSSPTVATHLASLRSGARPGHAAREPRRRAGDQRGRLAVVVRPDPLDVTRRQRDRRPGAGAGARFGLTAASPASSSPTARREDPMSVRTTPPFRADHVGSLLRPRALLQARENAARGMISADELRAIEDDAIRGAVRMQEDIGLRSVTDGEFRRASWHMDFIYEIAGVQQAEQNLPQRVPQRGRRHRVHPGRGPGHGQARDGPHDLRLRVRVPSRHRDHRDPEADDPGTQPGPLPGRPRGDRPAPSTRTSTSSGRTSAPPTRTRSGGWPPSAARTSSSTTPAWRTSTTRRSARRSPAAARTPSTSTRPISSPSTGRYGIRRPG